MSTQPVHLHESDQPRVEHSIGSISEALRGSRRAQFFAEQSHRSPRRTDAAPTSSRSARTTGGSWLD